MADDISNAPARRRLLRWLTLGEILGISALVISGLTFWNNYSERRLGEETRTAEQQKAAERARTIILKATVERDGDRLVLNPAADQVIQGQTITFPAALGVDPVESTDARIEAGWFASGLKKARKAAGEREQTRGDARLPVAITTRFTTGGDLAENVVLYDIGYVAEGGGLFGSSEIRLRGLSLIGRTNRSDAQRRVDALWSGRHKNAAKNG